MQWPALFFCLLLTSCSNSDNDNNEEQTAEEADPAEIAIGERLFLETRFAQLFSATDANSAAGDGDPTLTSTVTIDAYVPCPFAGELMNCAASHLVDQQFEVSGGGMRSYAAGSADVSAYPQALEPGAAESLTISVTISPGAAAYAGEQDQLTLAVKSTLNTG